MTYVTQLTSAPPAARHRFNFPPVAACEDLQVGCESGVAIAIPIVRQMSSYSVQETFLGVAPTPKPFASADRIRKSHPEVWQRFTALADACHETGSLDGNT